MTDKAMPRTLRTLGALAVMLAAAACDKGSQAQTEVPAKAPAAAAPATAQPSAATQDPPLATLGAVSVPRSEIENLLRALPPAQREQLQADRSELDRIIRARLAEKALVAEARAQGWNEREAVRRALEAAQEQVLLRSYLDSVSEPPDSYPSEAELQAAYEQNKDRFVQPASYRISQIFLAAPYGDAEAVAQARKQAADLARRANAPKADFAALAKEHSQDAASAARGGDNGFVPLPQLVPELRGIVQGMKVGQVSDPVQLPAGFHILKLVDVREARTAPLTEVQVQLRNALRAQRQEQAARAYLEGLVNAGTVSIDGKAVNAAFEAVK
ncbi:peptidylprolyl isomerase [Orrella sp. JC864]|uniref:peptidylprolyl isomerase n=1 Tax=Orrella sp. JC864 TaxID=3120298 RepID=UPI00300A7661